LANFGEAEFDENGYDFIGFEDGNIAHDSSYGNVLNSNKLGLKRGFAVFEKHFNNVVQVSIDFIQGLALGMSAGEAGHETDEQARFRAPLDYRRIDFHDWLQNRIGRQIMLLRFAIGNRRLRKNGGSVLQPVAGLGGAADRKFRRGSQQGTAQKRA